MRYIPLVTALFSTLGAAAQSYDSPATVAIDRDAPRSEIVAYSTLSDALTFDRAASRYLRPIADWQEERNESGRLLTGEFSMPFAWIDRELFLHVASAGSSYEVTVNGKRAGYVQDGTTPADFDITRLATEGKNRVTVTLFAPAVADALPISSSYWEARPPNMLDRLAPKSLNTLTPAIVSPDTMPM